MRRRTSGTRITVANGDGSPRNESDRAISCAFRSFSARLPSVRQPWANFGRLETRKKALSTARGLAIITSASGEKTGATTCGRSSVGRAQPCHGWGREFESRRPLHSVANLAASGRIVVIKRFLARRHSQVAKAEVCKTSIPQFESGCRLHFCLLSVGK